MIITKDREIENWSQIDRSDLLSMNKINIDKIDQTLFLAEKITQGLSPEATHELFKSCGTEDDIDLVFDKIFDETYRVMFGGLENGNSPKIESINLGYLEKLSASVEEELRCNSLSYFITSLMPDFDMGWHHLDWARIPGMFKKFLILAARDHGKSVKITTPVRLHSGKIALAKDLVVGDQLIGMDGTKRTITNIGYGIDNNMYEISQYRGDVYTVNSRHTLTLFKKIYKWNPKMRTSQWVDSELVDIDIEDYLKLSEYQRKTLYYGFKVGLEFPKQNVTIDPYWLGMWLGDGTRFNTEINKPDKEVLRYCIRYAIKLGMAFTLHRDEKGIDGCSIVSKSRNKVKGSNKLLNDLREYNLIDNKHIPAQYLCNSKAVRYQLLAGLIDTDGNLHDGCYYISQNNEELAKQIKDLADGLGFATTIRKRVQDLQWMKREDKTYNSWEVTITGQLHKIPCQIKRKKVAYSYKQNHKELEDIFPGIEVTTKSPLKVKNVGRDEYVSITVDGDKRFVLGDGTVTHNSYMFSNAYPAWMLYKYKPKTAKERTNNRGFLFSFSVTQAIDLLEILKDTIVNSDELRERLYNKERWSKLDITCKNRARFTVKGFGSAVRGAHPYWIIIDDGLKDNVLYSSEQNQKTIDYFHAVIENLLIPGGSLGLVGTPFRVNDLYGHLKVNRWPTFEYPAIFPDGTLLWPERWNYAGLMAKRKSQGNLIFSRELLVKPVTSDSTIFPIEILNTAFYRMDNYVLVHNVDSFPVKFKRVVTGCYPNHWKSFSVCFLNKYCLEYVILHRNYIWFEFSVNPFQISYLFKKQTEKDFQ